MYITYRTRMYNIVHVLYKVKKVLDALRIYLKRLLCVLITEDKLSLDLVGLLSAQESIVIVIRR